jgi:trigger factor
MDFLGSIDGVPFGGGEGRDQMVELGSGRLVPGFEDQLTGASAGEDKTVTIEFPDDYGAPDLAGKQAEFAVTVKEVKAKELPELDEDFAAEAGFDTLDELREDIRTRIAEAETARIEAEFREAALDSVVKNAKLDMPDALVEARAREQWDQMLHSLAHQGISREAYMRIAGTDESEIVERAKPEAETALRREAVLAAVIEAESIEPSDDEVMEAVEQAAGDGPGSTSPKKLLERLKSSGRIDSLKDDLAQRKALDLIADSAKPITIEQAQARDKLWTPGRDESGGSSGQLWTPSS